MDEHHMTWRVMMADESGGRVQGRPRLGWMDDVKVALGSRGMMVQAQQKCMKDRKEWRALCIWRWLSFTQPYLLDSCSFRLPSCALVAYHQEGGGLLHGVGVNCKMGTISDAKQKNSFFNKKTFFLNHHPPKIVFYFFILQFKKRKRYFNTLECLFCYSYYILHNTGCKTIH